MRYISIKEVRHGDVLARPILDASGNILVQSNVALSDFRISQLKEKKYQGVFIYDELSKDIQLQEDLPLNLKLEALQALSEIDIDACLYLANNIVQALSSQRNIITDLSALCNHDTYTYYHCINVAKYCAVLGIRLNLADDKLKNLVASALLHDLGKLCIPANILNSTKQLTDEERALIEEHPTFGYDILKQDITIPSAVRIAVYEHHENFDGTGYPRGLNGCDISDLAMIIHVCDVFDALISKRSYKQQIQAFVVIEYLMSQCGKQFDINIVSEFIKSLILFPKGTFVNLSDNTQAIVFENNPDYPLRPIIIRLDGTLVDLLSVNNLTIIDYAI